MDWAVLGDLSGSLCSAGAWTTDFLRTSTRDFMDPQSVLGPKTTKESLSLMESLCSLLTSDIGNLSTPGIK